MSIRQEWGPMLRLAGPLVVASVGWMAMGIVDTMMVGRLPHSAAAIGAVSLGSALFLTVGIFGGGLLLGLDTLVSQSFGTGRVDECHHSLLNAVYLGVALTPLLMGAVWLCIPLLQQMDVDPAVLQLAIPYLKAVTWGTLPLMLYFAARPYLQAMNLVKPVAFTLVSANLVNAAANWVLIFGHLGAPPMGAVGAGWATTISRVYMAGVLLFYIVLHDRRYGTGLWRVAGRPDPERIRRLFALGLPASMQLVLEIGVFATVTVLIGKLGAVPLASHQVALNTASLTFMVPLGVSSAAAVRVGQGLGRRDPRGAALSGWTAILLGAGFMGCAALVFVTMPHWIARVYTPDPTVIAASVSLLMVAAVFQLFDGIQVVAIGALRGAGDTRTPMLTHLVALWAVGLPVGFWLGFHRGMGAVGLWIGLCVGLVLAGIILLAAWRRRTQSFPGAG